MATSEQALADLKARITAGLRSNSRQVVLRWYRLEATGFERWLRNAADDPRSAAARVPWRLACRILRCHNWSCVGQPKHPARW